MFPFGNFSESRRRVTKRLMKSAWNIRQSSCHGSAIGTPFLPSSSERIHTAERQQVCGIKTKGGFRILGADVEAIHVLVAGAGNDRPVLIKQVGRPQTEVGSGEKPLQESL